MSRQRTLLVALALLSSACADRATGPSVAAPPSAAPPTTSLAGAAYRRIASPETEAITSRLLAPARPQHLAAQTPTTGDPGIPCYIAVSPGSMVLDVTGRAAPTSRVVDASVGYCGGSGPFIGSYDMFWTSDNPSIAGAGAGGLVFAIGEGTTSVCANYNGLIGCTTVTVLGPPVLSTVTLTSGTDAIARGGTVQLTPTAKDQYGITLEGVVYRWTSDNPAAATVSASGLVTGVAVGNANISACAWNGTKDVCASHLIMVDPLWVDITGPTSVNLGSWGMWQANGHGGVPGYTYRWTIDGVVQGTPASQVYWGPGTSGYHQIRIDITDTRGVTSANTMVFFTSENPCYPASC